MKKTHCVISLGGSTYYKKNFRSTYLKNLARVLEQFPNIHFYIICGGGHSARVAIKNCKGTNKEKDLAGIKAINENAQRIQNIMSKILPTRNKIEKDFRKTKKCNKDEQIVVCGAIEPGHSTDWNASTIAQLNNITHIINLSDIDYVYTKNPKYKSAKPLINISWKEYFNHIDKKRVPGGHYPYDPIAAKVAQKNKQHIFFVNGNKLNRIENLFNTNFKECKGTIVKP